MVFLLVSSVTAISYYDLKWDTEFFGVDCAKAVLHSSLSTMEWNELQSKFNDSQFISITNLNSDPVNAQLIGKTTTAFLADINIQFVKKLNGLYELPENITIHQSMERNNKIFEIANFKYSKFTEDQELAKRNGNQVYHQWLLNAFEKPDKHFALSRDENQDINGFVLYSISNNYTVIELIAVSPSVTHGGVGTRLFKAVEYASHKVGINEIKVGTQSRNLGAINFYHKVGCKQVGCHQVYHLWNL